MKPEEAKKYLKFYAGDGLMKYVLTPIRTEALIYAIDALEKQIPKKPFLFGSKPIYLCPNCNRAEYIKRRDALDTHCGFCGQAIDWCDSEEE